VRALPALPQPETHVPKSLEVGLFHKVLVGLELTDMGPAPLAISVAGLLDAVAALIAGGPVVAAALRLAGHTHGGQVRVPAYGALVTAPLYSNALEMGLYQLRDMLLFVSRGVGLEGNGAPRVRLNCRPQLKLFVLRGPVQDIA